MVDAHYGLLDLDTFQTERRLTVLGGGSITYDPFSDTLVVSARDTLLQYDPVTLALVSTLDLDPGDVLDDRMVAFGKPVFDGQGGVYVTSGIGRSLITWVDYRSTGRLGEADSVAPLQHFDRVGSAVMPLVGPGSLCYAAPGITDFDPAPGTHLPAGTQVLLTGTAGLGDLSRPVESVVVDGVPAAIDATGRFFAPITVAAGPQTIRVEVVDRCGYVDQSLELVGTLSSGDVPLAYQDITHQVGAVFRDTTWNAQTRTLDVLVEGTNLGSETLRGPLRLVVGPADERVDLAQADTFGSDGRPAVTLLPAGQTLEPGETLPATLLSFTNPAQLQLRANARWEYAGNQAPAFVTAPTLEAVADQRWSYDARAVDPEGDPITYRLEQGPIGAALDPSTGVLSWTPSELEAGLHSIVLAAEDGLGGVGRQAFQLHVRLGDQNQPPLFTSAPPVLLDPGTSLVYVATAVDVEGDDLTFALLDGPSGAVLDPISGQLTWAGSPTEGTFPFTLSVSDGRGGEATQSFTLTVGTGLVLGGAPQITSLPPLQVAVDALYAYVPTATDPEGDALTWWLVEAPSGMGIDPATGRLLWTPSTADIGAHDVELAVTDGTSSTTQRWQVAVADAPPNATPVFVSAPVLSAVSGALYTYQAEAEDPEGAELTYELFSGPAGAVVDPATGLVQWMPGAPGDVPFVVQATDPGGAAALQAWAVRVRASNGAPTVFVDPAVTVAIDQPLVLQATAVDPDGDPVVFSLEGSGTSVFAIDADGTITGTDDFTASYVLDVVATDALGARGVASVAISVVDDDVPPVVDIQIAGPVCADQSSTVCVSAYDELHDLKSVTLQVDGVTKFLDDSECAEVTWGPGGVPMLLEATAQESKGFFGGLIGLDELEVVPDPGCAEVVAPAVAFTSPVDGERLAVPTDVVATATGLTVDTWRYLLDGAELASGSGALPAVIDVFDPTLRENGLYALSVEVVDTDGLVHTAQISALVEGAMKLGTFELAYTDASWSTAISATSVVRAYTTLRKDAVGDFGHGWDLATSDVRITTNGPLGEGGWGQESCGLGLIFVPVCFTSTKPHIAVVTWPNGVVESFDFVPAETSTFSPLVTSATFEPRPGVASTLEAVDETVFTLYGGSLYTNLDFGTVYDPQRFVLTDAAGVEYLLDKTDGLLQITDRSGNQTVYTDDGIQPDVGIGVSWVRDALGRIERMDLADGTFLTYGYDAAGDLVTVTDASGDVVEFTYDAEHRLVAYNDAGHPPVAELVYDADGRLISSTDASGVFVQTSSDTVGWSETTVGPDPTVTTTTYFNADGLTERVVEDVAGVVREASWTYTPDYLVATATAPSGAVSTYAYDDALRLTRAEDADGVVAEWVYGAFQDVTEVVVGGEVVGRWVFDDEGHLLSEHRPDGSVLHTMTYDDQGVLSTFRDADGVGGEMLLSSDGSQATGMLLGPAGAAIEVTVGRDALGRMTSMTGPDGTTSTAVYDDDGMQTQLVDPNGHVQRWDYDERGLLVAAYDKADLATTYVYDDASRLISQTDRNGDTLTYTYDALGRLERVDGPDTFVAFTYDAVGRVLSVTNPEQVLGFTWGIDGELLTATSGPVVLGAYPELTHTYTWSPGGRLDQVDSTHGSITYAYDLQGRVVSQVDSRTGEVSYAWAPDGRLLSLTRASGWTTTFDYTAGDRLERTQTLDGNVLVQDDLLEWDLFGLLGAATDTFGRHTYTYDPGGQLLAADHPAASGIPDKAYTYDPLGNRTSWQGHPQSEVVHDAQDRLVQDAEFLYAYDAEGQLVRKEERGSGQTWRFEWNSFGQLVRMEHPDGSETTFAYDGLGRRVQVVDQGDVTRFGWDGDEVRMAFDGANALTRWEATDLFGELLATYDAVSGTVDEVVRNHLGTNQEQARDSFGNPVLASTGFSSHALTWHTQDPTGLIYARARYLDPKTGRFLSEDPIVSGDRYGYALNNPLTMWDPYGLTSATENRSLSQISLAARQGLKELGEEIACQLTADAAAVALSPTLGVVIQVAGCSAFGRVGKPKGGSYGKTRRKNCGGEVHHMPAHATTPYSHYSGPAIWMSTRDHKRTASWGSSQDAIDYRAKQKAYVDAGRLDKAIRMDFNDLRCKFGHKYDGAMLQMINYILKTSRR